MHCARKLQHLVQPITLSKHKAQCLVLVWKQTYRRQLIISGALGLYSWSHLISWGTSQTHRPQEVHCSSRQQSLNISSESAIVHQKTLGPFPLSAAKGTVQARVLLQKVSLWSFLKSYLAIIEMNTSEWLYNHLMLFFQKFRRARALTMPM